MQTDQCFIIYQQEEEEDFDFFAELCSNATIMDGKYQAASPEEVMQQELGHPDQSQQQQLLKVMPTWHRICDLPGGDWDWGYVPELPATIRL